MADEYAKFNRFNPTNIWYHDRNDSDYKGKGNDNLNDLFIPDMTFDSGMNHRGMPNQNSDYNEKKYYDHAEDYLNKTLSLDANNPLWKYDDSTIKQTVIKKLQDHFGFVNNDNMNVSVDRDKKIIKYKFVGLPVASKQVTAEIEYMKIPFNNLDVGDLFHMDKNVMEGSFTKLSTNYKWQQLGDFAFDTPFVKKSPIKICTQKKEVCIDLEFTLADVAINAQFYLNTDKIQERTPKVYKKIVDAVGEVTWETVFTKKTEDTITAENGVSIKVSDAKAVPIFFTAFVVVIDKKSMPNYTKPIGDLAIGTLFTVPDAELRPESVQDKYKPFNTRFMKISNVQFVLYSPGSFNLRDFEDLQLDEDENIKKVQRKYKEKIFEISPQGDEITNWDRRIVSQNMQVIEVGTEDLKPKKQNTLEDFMDSMFNKYTVKKDELGEHITISEAKLPVELGAQKLVFDDFSQKERQQSYKDERGEGTETVGSVGKYAWIHDGKGNIIITR